MNFKTLLRPLLLLVAASAGYPLHAQDFPNKPITVQHGFAAGGQTDVSLRVMAEAMTRKLGQAAVVQPRPGGAQSVVISALKAARPDGYTIAHIYQGAFSITPLLQNVSYTLDELEPVIAWQVSTQLLVVRAESPLKNLADLVAAAKAKPQEPPTFGHQGKGSVNFVSMVVFARQVGIPLMTDVQFKGDSDTMYAILGGHIQVASVTDVAAAPLLAAGKIRALATFAPARTPNLPNVPTFKDQGFEVSLQPPTGIIFVTKGTPAPVVAKLHDSIKSIIEDDRMKKEFGAMNLTLYYMDGKSVPGLIEMERKTFYEPILREAGLAVK